MLWVYKKGLIKWEVLEYMTGRETKELKGMESARIEEVYGLEQVEAHGHILEGVPRNRCQNRGSDVAR